MIENATNLTNITNLTTQSEGMAIGPIINWLKTFFSKPYAEPILIAVLILVTIMLFSLKEILRWLDKRDLRFQTVYEELLMPGIIKLDHDEKGLRYNHQEDEGWGDFIVVINKQLKRRRYKARDLYEEAEKAADDYNSSVKSWNTKTISLLNGRLNKEGLNLKNWDGEGKVPSEDYVISQLIPSCIDGINSQDKTLAVQSDIGKESAGGKAKIAGTGRGLLLCNSSTIAESKSESKMEQLKDLIESIADAEETKELFAKRDSAENDMKQKLERYNNKLAEVIRDFRLYPCRGIST